MLHPMQHPILFFQMKHFLINETVHFDMSDNVLKALSKDYVRLVRFLVNEGSGEGSNTADRRGVRPLLVPDGLPCSSFVTPDDPLTVGRPRFVGGGVTSRELAAGCRPRLVGE